MLSNDFPALKSDEELVVLTLAEKENYRCLVERYEKKLMRYIIRLSGMKTEDAEDVLQEVFIKAYQNLNDFDPGLKFSSWIYRISHNVTVSHLRKARSRPKTVEFGPDFDIFSTIGSDLDIELEMDRKMLGERIAAALKKIDGKYRDVLVLKFMEDKDYREISDILKKPMGSVATLISRAKKQLKNELGSNKDFLEDAVPESVARPFFLGKKAWI